jgi:hypothetical protein
MRQTDIAGEKLFVDFAGRTGEVVDGLTGEIIPVQIFVAVGLCSPIMLPRSAERGGRKAPWVR